MSRAKTAPWTTPNTRVVSSRSTARTPPLGTVLQYEDGFPRGLLAAVLTDRSPGPEAAARGGWRVSMRLRRQVGGRLGEPLQTGIPVVPERWRLRALVITAVACAAILLIAIVVGLTHR